MKRHQYVCDGCGRVFAEAKASEILVRPQGTFTINLGVVQYVFDPKPANEENLFGIDPADACSLDCARKLFAVVRAHATVWLEARARAVPPPSYPDGQGPR